MLEESQLELIDDHRTEVIYKKGQNLCKQGSFISNMKFLRDGYVKVYIEKDERSSLLGIEGAGHFLGLPFVLLDEGVYNYNAVALTDCKVCMVDVNTFRELIFSNCKFGSEMLKAINRELLRSYSRTFSLANKNITGRFAEFLLYLQDHVYRSTEFELNISRKDMAEYISTTQESISRLIKQLREDSVIHLENTNLKILDERKLQYLSRVG
jgi:CRP/FNR family transcriptional regulator